MKTYLKLLKSDYEYLDDVRYYIGNRKNKIYRLEFNPYSLKTIEDYYVKELDYHKTIINIINTHYLEHAKDISEHKNAIIDIIDKCMRNISNAIDEEKNNG